MNYKEKELYEKQYRIWKMFLWISGTIGLLLLIYLCRFVNFAAHRYQLNKAVREAVTQISQLTINIRVFYSVHKNEPIPSLQKMIEMGAIPSSLFKDQVIANPFGGKIIIEPAKPLINEKENTAAATFKISYQGLSHEACVKLATINWGTTKQGLVAVAAGNIDEYGIDTALQDVDGELTTQQYIETTDKRGKKRLVHAATNYKMNVAQPQNSFSPVPFSESAADIACSCEKYENCSFALNYTLSAYSDTSD